MILLDIFQRLHLLCDLICWHVKFPIFFEIQPWQLKHWFTVYDCRLLVANVLKFLDGEGATCFVLVARHVSLCPPLYAVVRSFSDYFDASPCVSGLLFCQPHFSPIYLLPLLWIASHEWSPLAVLQNQSSYPLRLHSTLGFRSRLVTIA